MIRVLVVDDHPVVRTGLVGMLADEPDIEVCGEGSSGVEAVRLVRALAPDVVLMDLRMPGGDGVSATREIVALPGRAPRVVVVTTYDTDADILRAVEAGATGYLLKDSPRQQMADAVRAAARGETVLAPPVAAKLMTRMRADPSAVLTPREVEVIELVGSGLTNADIGRRLFISEATVKTHLLRVFAKLGVDDRTAAVTTAMARGIIPAP
ncbi:MAG: response regulator transcription factor [Geodermatophilaceae bacterium]|nr:response regulator transcription factor [Geodermatophilaceae bacterium]MDQ3455488.1 response regulator transcription factor [Actinomycetota bacterium]